MKSVLRGAAMLEFENIKRLYLKDICYIPDMHVNLLSLTTLQEEGFSNARLPGKTLGLTGVKNEVVFETKKRYNVNYVTATIVDMLKTITGELAFGYSGLTVPESKLWHGRFGYIVHSRVQPTVELLCGKQISLKYDFCSACING